MSGYIKLHRKLLDWEWWDDHNTTRLFIAILMLANYQDKNWRGKIIHAGTFVTSYETLGERTGLTYKQVRTSLEKLKSTGEVSANRAGKGQVLTLENWDKYQDENANRAGKGQAKGRQRATTKEYKEGKEYISNNTLNAREDFQLPFTPLKMIQVSKTGDMPDGWLNLTTLDSNTAQTEWLKFYEYYTCGNGHASKASIKGWEIKWNEWTNRSEKQNEKSKPSKPASVSSEVERILNKIDNGEF